MIEINITPQIKEEAIKHTEERMNYEYDRFKLSIDKRRSMILIGTIGQLIFKKFLESRNIDFSFEYQAGKYDNMDFKIGTEIIEIKTSGFDDSFYHLNLLYSIDQYKSGIKKQFKYCVQLFINGYNKDKKIINLEACNKCIIAGYIEFEEIAKYKNKKKFFGDDYKVPLKELKSAESLLKIFQINK